MTITVIYFVLLISYSRDASLGNWLGGHRQHHHRLLWSHLFAKVSRYLLWVTTIKFLSSCLALVSHVSKIYLYFKMLSTTSDTRPLLKPRTHHRTRLLWFNPNFCFKHQRTTHQVHHHSTGTVNPIQQESVERSISRTTEQASQQDVTAALCGRANRTTSSILCWTVKS